MRSTAVAVPAARTTTVAGIRAWAAGVEWWRDGRWPVAPVAPVAEDLADGPTDRRTDGVTE
ncbi:MULTISPECIES: hypothetical protein [Streptomyces]|uniref:Uncharacterized protein n=1 Tax=Streptomyces dengpaensis TaxID=2049881 RepID=A0ABM6SM99_9ACTN|nr:MULTISPECIES: hypothetical protein [Streptomyces]AVH55506.1 hypothetical protein C4B68_06625 [Streptomyces dengpaensis]PIB11772.1 hypothetical protein B1C81_00595 [Streptomyces sp. HG99]